MWYWRRLEQAKHALKEKDAVAAFKRCRERFGGGEAGMRASILLLNSALSRVGFALSNVMNDCSGDRYWVFCNKVGCISAHVNVLHRVCSQSVCGVSRLLQHRSG